MRRRAIATLQQLHSGALVRRHHHASAQAAAQAAEGGAWTAEGCARDITWVLIGALWFGRGFCAAC
eukprot:COSAG01_NODE_476_length_16515_cov_37.730690_13_plen_66_part_00